MAELTWFRVELNSAGKVVSCTVVSGPTEENNRVFCVQAPDAHAAHVIGRAAYTEYCRTKVRETRARNEANDLCRCGGVREDPDFKRCRKCRRLDKGSRARYERRLKGEDVPPPDRFETVAAERDRSKTQLRLEVLREVRRKLVSLRGDTNALSRWLVQQIDALIARSAA
jgi:hypothetical protein